MKLTHLSIKNYKSLRDVECRLSNFVCAVGKNNAGKSTLLQAVLLFVNGTKLTSADYYDSGEDVVITVTLSGVDADALASLTDDHRAKMEPLIRDNTLVLARRYSTDGSSKLRVITHVPRDAKLRSDAVDDVFKGKSGKDVRETLLKEYSDAVPTKDAEQITTQKAAKEAIQAYVGSLPDDQLILDEVALPTGIDNSVRSILPEPVYIPAVKDLADDLKSKDSATFGKLLGILLDVIEDELTEASETFEALRKDLNRIVDSDGNVSDDRKDRVRMIEQTIQTNLAETFGNVSIELQIPPPEIKTVLSNATLIADDGVRGPVDYKGDGFKRAVAFSILRSYVHLSQDQDWKKPSADARPTKDKFVFLFEEPELFLHPSAQNVLFDALARISKNNQVLVTTHSPLFFSSTDTTTFVKLDKQQDANFPRPYSSCVAVDLTDVSERDKFQIISFESSNLAFFSSRIVLVEGDSELITLPHIARLLNPSWDFSSSSTNLNKVAGKGSFTRFAEFFTRFGVDVAIVGDLDVLLEGFDKLSPSERAKHLREDLIREVDKVIAAENLLPETDPKLIKKELQTHNARVLYDKIAAARTAGDTEETTRLLDEFFSFEFSRPRLDVLKDASRAHILEKKRELLAELRRSRVFILERGAIEDYYPHDLVASDKPSMAQSFCKIVSSREQVHSLCDEVHVDGELVPEFEVVMRALFAR